MSGARARNVLLVPVGSHGDVHPFVGVGLELARRGHAVRAYTSGYYAGLFEAVGITLDDGFPADRFRILLDDPRLWEPGLTSVRQVMLLATEQADSQYEYLAGRAGDPDLLVLASPLAFGARVAQDRFGLRLATLQLAPAAIPSLLDPPRVFGLDFPAWLPLWARRAQRAALGWLSDRMFASLQRLRRRVGLAPAARIVGEWWNSPTLTVGMFPEWFSGRPADWPDSLRTAGFPLYDEADVSPLDPALAAFLDAHEGEAAPVAFTAGSAMTQGADFFAAAAGACERLGRAGVLLTRHPEQLPPSLPDGVLHVPYAPFSRLLPRTAALVHHGGIGSLSQALAAGVPQVIMPMAHDQPDNAERARGLGVASVIERRDLGPEALASMLAALLADPRVAESCRAAARRVERADGISATCDLVEAMA